MSNPSHDSVDMADDSRSEYSFQSITTDYDVPVSTIKFGDLFGTRSDYSKGVFYGGKRRYLTDESNTTFDRPADENNALAPPESFMTKKQTRKQLKKSSLSHFKKLDFNVVQTDADQKAAKAALIRKQEGQKAKRALRPPAMLVLEKYSSYRKKDWTEVKQAGCTFYVNKSTGEVTSEIPWKEDDDEALLENMSLTNTPMAHHSSMVEPGSSGSQSRSTLAGSRSSALVSKLRSTVLSNHKSISSVAKTLLHANRIAEKSNALSPLVKGDKDKQAQKEEDEFVVEPGVFGTGAHVYDRSELEDFFSVLDRAAAESKKRPVTAPVKRSWRDS